MSGKLKNLVNFDIGRLFNGAIDVDWLASDKKKAEQVASAFVFHGPSYHGVSQKDVNASGHKLIDSASFALRMVENLNGSKSNPFVLAIAGFGSGKSHLAVTFSELLSTSNAGLKKSIIDNISQADTVIAKKIQQGISPLDTSVLVLTLNGMNNGDLSSMLLVQLKAKIAAAGLDSTPLENLRKRFKHAANLLKGMDIELLKELFTVTGVSSKDDLITRLGEFDENTYKQTHEHLQTIGIPLNVIGDETAKDVLNLVAKEYVGEDKPFKKLLILFDEFGHYMEFATSKPQIAGNGALQHLFEGIQNNDGKIEFVGFVQYELKAYEQRLPFEFKNEIRRFITRFDNADKLYLSSNLETLVASLIEKPHAPQIDLAKVEIVRQKVGSWYPVSQTFATWADSAMFAKVIAEGCWPLSPLAMWVLFSLSAIGKYLQQRSALTLLKAALSENEDFQITDTTPSLPPVALWTTELQQEFESIEEEQAHGAVIQAYNAILEKIGQHISQAELKVLRAIVLLAQTHLRASNKDDAFLALEHFTGLPEDLLMEALAELEGEKNVIAWDDAVNQYEFLSDSVSRPQFLRTLRTKAVQEYDLDRKSRLFIKGTALVPSLVTKIECDFSNENSISTPEWHYDARVTYWELFKKTVVQLTAELKSTSEFMPIDAARGLVIYCYVPDSESSDTIKQEAQRILKAYALNLPVILVLLFDSEAASISKPLVDLDIMENFSTQEKEQYNRLIGNHQKKQLELLENAVKKALLERNFLTAYPQTIEVARLKVMGNALFDKIFPKAIPFPFDGYATGRGNAAKDCMVFTSKLLTSGFRFDDTQTMPVQQRNRAQTVLGEAWKVFAKDGSVALKQSPASIRSIVLEWDSAQNENKGLNCAEAIRSACSIPYGASLPLAGLLFAVYYQARQNNVSLLKNGERISFSSVINNLFSGQTLNISELENITLYKAESGNSEWDQLLADWSNCESYKELSEFLERKENLAARLPVPATLRGSIIQLERQAAEAKRKIEEADQEESKAIQKLDIGIQISNISYITEGASLLQSWLKTKKSDPMWSITDDIEPIAEKIIKAKQHIIQGFPVWLNTQRPPNGLSLDALSEFKRELVDRVGSNLKNLELVQEREKLVKHVESISRFFEDIAKARQAIMNADGWIAANLVLPSAATVLQLDEKKALVEQQIEVLKPCRTSMKRINKNDIVDDLTTRIDKLETFVYTISSAKKAIEKRARVICNTELSITNADSIVEEVSELIRLCTGTSADLADFRLMRALVDEFINIGRRLDALGLSQVDFETLSAKLKEDFISRFTAEEPPWDPEETIDKLMLEVAQKRDLASKEWTNRIEERYADVENLTIQDGNTALQTLSALPPYFNATKDGKQIERIKKSIVKHLQKQGIEWLYEKFTQLSPSAQKAFLNLVKGRK